MTPPSPNPNGSSRPSKDDLLLLGETTFRNDHRRFGLHGEDRLRHVWVLGMTGSGKSTLLENLILQDLHAGRGLALLDPHGDLARAVLAKVPDHRIGDVIRFAPEDRDWPISWNVFRQGREPWPDPGRLASHLIAVFRAQWADSWGPRLEHVLRNAILAIASDPRASLLFLYRFLIDEPLRKEVVARVQDPVVRLFWEEEFAGYGDDLRAEAMSPVLNKLGAFIAHPLIRNITGQERSRLDIGEVIREGKVIIATLPAGVIGEDASRLLGGLLLASIQLAAMARPERGRSFFVYADEFQRFLSDSAGVMLSEARKYRLGFTAAHQYLAQLPPTIRDAVLGNAGTIVLFRLGSLDAKFFAEDFGPEFTGEDLRRLDRYHFAIRMLAHGIGLRPFSAKSFPPGEVPDGGDARMLRIRDGTRARHCRPRALVESAIAAQLPAPAVPRR